jgi:hypothetical protein
LHGGRGISPVWPTLKRAGRPSRDAAAMVGSASAGRPPRCRDSGSVAGAA